MGIKEPEKRPGIGMVVRKLLGRTSPKENGMLWVEGRIFDLQRLGTIVSTYHLAEGVKGTGAAPTLRRFGVSEVNRRLYEIEVRNFAGRHGLDQEELLAMEPRKFFQIAAETILSQSLVNSIRTSKSSPDKVAKTLNTILAEVEKRVNDPSLPSDLHVALLWFHRTGFDKALLAAREPQG